MTQNNFLIFSDLKLTKSQIKKYQKYLMEWYQKNKRDLPWRRTNDPYLIWVSEVMAQQTQIQTVIPYYERFVKRFPNVKQLAEADLREVLKLWEGLGYYGRARNMHRAAKQLLAAQQNRLPDQLVALQKLAGIGEYTAAAIASVAFELPHAVVDGNVYRVLARLFEISLPINQSSSSKTFELLAQELLSQSNPGDYNQAIMELGALVCTPKKPNCQHCPVSDSCRSYQVGSVDQYPVKIKPKSRPEYQIAIAVIVKKDRVLITKRKNEGLLGGLWEFPGGKIEIGETAQEACVREAKEEVNLNVEVYEPIKTLSHGYTHFKVNLSVFLCRYISGRVKLNSPVDHQWVKISQIDRYPFPAANKKFIPELNQYLTETSK